jgi:hypothetical protein
MDHAEDLHDFYEVGRMENSHEDGDSIARLRDGQAKLVTTRCFITIQAAKDEL